MKPWHFFILRLFHIFSLGIPYEVLNLGLADKIEKMGTTTEPRRLPDLPDFGVGSASAAWRKLGEILRDDH